MTLDLTGKRCPVIFSAVLFFVFEKFSANARFADSIVWKNKSFLWKGHRQEKNCVFEYVICGK